MIYQLFYKNDFGIDPFNNNYVKFDLNNLTEDKYFPSIQSEYCAMIYAWYNNIDNDSWIGFTSCRQRHKGFFTHVREQPSEIIHILNDYQIITWGWLCHKDIRFCGDHNISTLFQQAERFHKGIMNSMNMALSNFDHHNLIDLFSSNTCGIFANYWLMSKSNFYKFMEWSYPIVNWMITKPSLYDTRSGHYNMIGFIIERLFIYWYLINHHTIKILNFPIINDKNKIPTI